jgi:8-oxo-dGTP pyrophosphatase MutT (NUDIX family)
MNKPMFKSRPNELITTTDGRKLYHSRSVAVVVVLACMDTNGAYKFAIEKRGTNPGLDKQGLWCLPCGYLDWDESGTQAVKREVWEEIGLDLDEYKDVELPGSPGLEQPWFVKTSPDENRQNVTLRYGMTFIKRELPKLTPNNDCEPNEVADAQWVNYSDILLGKYEFAFNHDKVIAEYRKFTP